MKPGTIWKPNLFDELIELRTRQLGEGHNQVMEVSIDLATVNRRIGNRIG